MVLNKKKKDKEVAIKGSSSGRPPGSLYKRVESDTDATTSGDDVGQGTGTTDTASSITELASYQRSSPTLVSSRPELNEDEHQLFDYVNEGNVSAAFELLSKDEHGFSRDIDVNKANNEGYSVIQIAVQREDEAMVELLLNVEDIHLQDALFLAIKEDNMQMVRMIVEFEVMAIAGGNIESNRDKLAALGRIKGMKDQMKNSEFEEDVTPLILAAHAGSFQLIEYFYTIGERLPDKPHYEKKLAGTALMKMATRRIRWYKAISNPFYISFMANEDDRLDPILEAFNLADEMRHIANKEPDFKADYEEMVENLKEYTGDLMDLCRTQEEVSLLCKQKEGYKAGYTENPRLVLAIERDQTHFVVHSFAQEVLYEVWARNCPKWKNKSNWWKFGFFVLHFIATLLQVVFLGLAFFRQRGNGKPNRFSCPLYKFMRTLSSYLIFLVLLGFQCAWPRNLNSKKPDGGETFLFVIECIIIAFVVGHIMSMLKHIMTEGYAYYFSTFWSWYEVLNQLVFLVTFALWAVAWIEAGSEVEVKGELGERKYWSHFEPVLIAESFFAIATIMSVGRLLRVFQLHDRFGPLQIALGHMIKDFGLGGLFYFFLLFSFATGFCTLYKPYKKEFDEETVGGSKTHQNTLYTGFWESFEGLFWGLFNLSPTDGSDIITIHDHGNWTAADYANHRNHTITHHPKYTQWVGKFFAKAFQVLYTLMVGNTIVAMMANTAGKVFEDKDRSWKFGRTRTWLHFGRETFIPAPCNIIWPIIACIYKNTKGSLHDEHTPEQERKLRTDYAILIKNLLQRYFREKGEEGLENPATAEQVTRIREDVMEMKEKYKRINQGVIFLASTTTDSAKGQTEKDRLGQKMSDRKFSLEEQKPKRSF